MNKIKELYYKTADNPLLGLIPMIVFVLAGFAGSHFATALLVGFLTSYIVSMFLIASVGKGKIHALLFLIASNATLFVCAVLYFLSVFEELSFSFRSFWIIEAVFVLNLFLTVLFKKRIRSFIIKVANLSISALMLNSMDEYLSVSKIIIYVFVTHLIVTGIYFLLPISGNPLFEIILVWIVPLLFLVSLFIFEYFRLGYLRKKLAAEEWAAIVDDRGKVIGKIAKSETLKIGNKYLYPVVRIAVASAGRLFLAARSENKLLEPGNIDHPFEEYVQYEQTLDETAANMLKAYDLQAPTPRFSIKYLFENEKTKRLIYLYTVESCDESAFNRQKFENGKFWTQKQIEDNLLKGVFSECFEKEYEFLKDTLLLFCNPESEGASDHVV